MFSIINNSPFASGQAFVQDKNGNLVWMVAIKATFEISAETSRLKVAEEQEEPRLADEYREDPINSSLLHACDFAPAKQNVDVLLDATAYAPEEKPITELMVGVVVGSMKKVLNVVGNRYYDRFLGILFKTSPVKFIQNPIVYENAYGGWEEVKSGKPVLYEIRNPAGTGFFKKRSSAKDLRLPNIEYPGFPTSRKSKKNKIAGFGPIAPHWAPRIDYAGTIAGSPDMDLGVVRPKDFNPDYYQAASLDQQLKEVKGGEPVVLYHLHPEYSEIHCCLPTIDIEFETLIDNETVKQPGKLHSIVFVPDKLKLQMVWQANMTNGKQAANIEYTKITHEIHKL